MLVNGTVAKLLSRPWKDKTFHSFVLEGDERYFGTGTVKHKDVNPGNTIQFEASKNDKGYWEANTKTLELVAKEAAPARYDQVQPPKKVDWDAKDRIIQLQACRNTAIAFVNMVLTHGAIKLPTKNEAKFDALLALVNELTDQFTQENENVRVGKPARANVASEGESEAGEPESVEDSPWKED